MRGEDGEARVLERDEAHQHELRAALVAVHARGLVAVVAVGDQQLRAGERLVHGRAAAGSAIRQRRWRVPSSSVSSPPAGASRCGRERAPRRPVGVVVEREDRREVRAASRASGAAGPPSGPGGCARAGGCGPGRSPRRARARTGRGACARARPGRCSPARAPTARAPRRGRARPPRASAPAARRRGRRGPRRRAREVDLDRVVRRARSSASRWPASMTSYGGAATACGPPTRLEVVVQGAEGLDVGHAADAG